MNIIKARTLTHVPHFLLSFSYIGSKGSGCAFECDKEGTVDETKLNPCALSTYKEALSGQVTRRVDMEYRVVQGEDGYDHHEPIPGTGREVTYKVSKGEVQDHTRSHWTPAVGECNGCGAHVHLHGFTNTCECGLDYNMSGQQLASRSQWGEETGETLSDILAADDYTSYNDYGCQ